MNTLDDIDLPLPDRRAGKVRVSWELPGARRLFVTTDRLSAFDRIVAKVPNKGQVLNQLAAWWFQQTADIVANHLGSLPDPNALIATAATPLPVEVVVRSAITGVTGTSLWKRYADGERTIYGHRLPEGLHKNDLLPAALITPTTKAEGGTHDEPLTVADVVDKGYVDQKLWSQVCTAALAVFEHGQSIVVSVAADERVALLGDPRFFLPAYLGAWGWIAVDLGSDTDWGEVAELLDASFRLTATAKLIAELNRRA